MPADYEIVSVAEGDKWDKDFGQGTQYFQSYDLVLKGPGAPDAAVSLNRKRTGAEGSVPADKIPEPNTTLYLSINGTKAKEEQRDERQASSNGSGGAPREDDVGTSIEAQVAAYAASYVTAAWGIPDSLSKAAERIDFLGSAFFDLIQKLKAGQPVAIQGGTLQPPSDPVPAAEPVKTAEDIPF